jgi:hypothetical protein
LGKTVRELEHGPRWDRGLGVREQIWWKVLAGLEAEGPEGEHKRLALRLKEAEKASREE